MNKFKPDMGRHCYFQDPRYPVAICYDYKTTGSEGGYCRRYKKDLKVDVMVDERPDGVGHFQGQRHNFPVKCEECEWG